MWLEGRQRARRRYGRYTLLHLYIREKGRDLTCGLTPQKASFRILLCSTRKLIRLVLLKEVKPSSDLKMIKLLTFVKLFRIRHKNTFAKTRSCMTTANMFSHQNEEGGASCVRTTQY